MSTLVIQDVFDVPMSLISVSGTTFKVGGLPNNFRPKAGLIVREQALSHEDNSGTRKELFLVEFPEATLYFTVLVSSRANERSVAHGTIVSGHLARANTRAQGIADMAIALAAN